VRQESPDSGRTVLTGWTAVLVRWLEASGLDAADLVRRAGVPETALTRPESRIAQAVSARLWELAAGASGDPALGIAVSEEMRWSSLHALGFALLTSSTLGDAFGRLVRYAGMLTDAWSLAIESTDRGYEVVMGPRSPADAVSPYALDAGLASLVRLARSELGTDVSPVAVALAPGAPGDLSPFEAFFRCPVSFDTPDYRLVFNVDDVSRPLRQANATLAAAQDRIVAHYLQGLAADTTTDGVRQVLVTLLPAGAPDAQTVARALALSTRSLQRHLEEEGTTFRSQLEEVRRSLAHDYLRAGTHSVTEVSYLLGFSDSANFSRAFRRWTGVTPSQYPPDGRM